MTNNNFIRLRKVVSYRRSTLLSQQNSLEPLIMTNNLKCTQKLSANCPKKTFVISFKFSICGSKRGITRLSWTII